VNKLLSLPRPDNVTQRQGYATWRLGKVTRVHFALLKQLIRLIILEQDIRIELMTPTWKEGVLPLN